MKKLFIKLFRRPITFGCGITNHVTVLDSDKRADKDGMYSGLIKSVDFNKRIICIEEIAALTNLKPSTKVVSFDSIVTISRMRDGRLRMWIKVED